MLALVELSKGTSTIKDLHITIKAYEDMEAYEACAGILHAIKHSEYLTIRDIKNIINDEVTED